MALDFRTIGGFIRLQSPIMSTPTSSLRPQQQQQEGQENKLRDGPCSKQYGWLEECAARRGVRNENQKRKMQSCPSETDRLIKCVNRHPLYFQQ